MGLVPAAPAAGRREKFPLIVELEPLFQCNLACAGCGKIQHPEHVLRRRMPVEQAIGGDRGVRRADGLDRRRRAAGPPRDRRDRRRAGRAQEVRVPVHQRAAAGEEARPLQARRRTSPGRSTSTACASATTQFGRARRACSTRRSRRSGRPGGAASASPPTRPSSPHDSPKTVREVLDFLNDELEVDQMMISPAYAYEKAPDQEHFLGVAPDPRALPRGLRRRPAQALAAEPQPRCSSTSSRARSTSSAPPWGIPSYSVFGWQRPCYLMSDGYAETYKELIETTDWSKYGRGRDPRCDNCMAHCGYEPTAVLRTHALAAPVAAGAGQLRTLTPRATSGQAPRIRRSGRGGRRSLGAARRWAVARRVPRTTRSTAGRRCWS